MLKTAVLVVQTVGKESAVKAENACRTVWQAKRCATTQRAKIFKQMSPTVVNAENPASLKSLVLRAFVHFHAKRVVLSVQGLA